MWGGNPSIIYPENAIEADVDAICTGEGELAFAEWLDLHTRRRGFHACSEFLVQTEGRDDRPQRLPSAHERGRAGDAALPEIRGRGVDLRAGHGFRRIVLSDYLQNNGLAYQAIWSIGCPLHCHVLREHGLHQNDPKYKRIRHTSPEYIVEEVKRARQVHPHINTVLFHDDQLHGHPLPELTSSRSGGARRSG